MNGLSPRTDGLAMVLLFYTTLVNADLAQCEIFSATYAISGKCGVFKRMTKKRR